MNISDYMANNAQFAQYYSLSTTKMGMRDQINQMAGELQMLPDQGRIMQHNSWDVPAIPKGSFFDTYA